MKSKWYEYKEHAVALRESGYSIPYIETLLGIPRSTLSGWFKGVTISAEKRALLEKNKQIALKRARLKANEWHKQQKELRLAQAKNEAGAVLDNLDLSSSDVLDLALAMLYLGEGKKAGTTSISSSNPQILKFVLAVLKHNYQLSPSGISAELHLRADQDSSKSATYWATELGIPLENFRGIYKDKRTAGKASFAAYRGVCVLNCGRVDIQRKLVYLYNLFCQQVIEAELGD